MSGARIGAVLLLALTIGAAPTPATKKSATTVTAAGWTLSSDEIDTNTKTGNFAVPGKLTMTRDDGSTVDADRATGNYKKKRATLYGHVSVHDASGTFGLKSATGARHEPATLTADKVAIDNLARVYDANGSVHYVQGQTTVDAQTAHLNDVTHKLDLSGKVHVVQGERTLDAQTASYNTLTGDGEADGNAMLIFPGAAVSIPTPKPIIVPKIH